MTPSKNIWLGFDQFQDDIYFKMMFELTKTKTNLNIENVVYGSKYLRFGFRQQLEVNMNNMFPTFLSTFSEFGGVLEFDTNDIILDLYRSYGYDDMVNHPSIKAVDRQVIALNSSYLSSSARTSKVY